MTLGASDGLTVTHGALLFWCVTAATDRLKREDARDCSARFKIPDRTNAIEQTVQLRSDEAWPAGVQPLDCD